MNIVLTFAPPANVSRSLKTRWPSLIEACLEHAGKNIGFGAKTASGYGRLERDPKAEKQRIAAALQAREQAAQRSREEAWGRMSPADRFIDELGSCSVDRIHEITSKGLDALEKEELVRVAAALKVAYAKHGIWGKNQEKQKKREEKIKKILEGRK